MTLSPATTEKPTSRSSRSKLPEILRRPTGLLAVLWLVIITAIAIAAPALAPAGPLAQDLLQRSALPNAEHWLGTDALGRDLFARIAYGAPVSLGGMLLGAFVALAIGVPFGLAAGYFGRWVDRVLSFISDILMAIPFLLIVLVAFAIFPGNNMVSMLIFGLFASAPMYRIIRGATLTTAGELYVVAARATGLSHFAVLRRHVAPRIGGLIQVQASIVTALALAVQVGLGFLGLDVVLPDPSWGGLIADGTKNLYASLWPLVPATAVIVLTILALGVLGDSRRESASSRGALSLLTHKPSTSTAPPPVSDAILSVRDLTVDVQRKGQSPLTLVEGVSFDLNHGEILGLVGESGAGKSVTARALLGLNGSTTTSGSAYFSGRDLLSLGDRDLNTIRGSRIGFIGQDPMAGLDPLDRVGRQLREAVRTHHRISKKAADKRVLELLEQVRIPDPQAVARRYPFELSGGMAQRVCIALALAGDPELLIADEPTTALDVTVQMEVLGLLQRLRQERSLSIILVTHDWGVIADVCDRAVTMYAGEIVEQGSVDGMFAEPLHPYTLALRRSDPHLQPVGAQLISIPGAVPPPGDWPVGCRFADRCNFVVDACRTQHPDLLTVGDDHESRCIRVDAVKMEVNNEK